MRIFDHEVAKAIVDAFFDAQFEGGSYTKRVNMIGDIKRSTVNNIIGVERKRNSERSDPNGVRGTTI